MPLYHKLGDFPQKRHTQFENQMVVCIMNNSLERKVFMGTLLCYHVHRPSKGNYKIMWNLKSPLVKNKVIIVKSDLNPERRFSGQS
jgi:homogentisate 1,2-dioxygenase